MLHLAMPAAPAGTDLDPQEDGHYDTPAGAVAYSATPGTGWNVPVLRTTATTGEGVDVLAAAIDRHGAVLRSTGGWATRERARSRGEIEHLLRDRFIDEARGFSGDARPGLPGLL